MTVITISRELGSEGDSIANLVSKTLNYRFIDKVFVGNVLSQYGLVEFDTEYDTLPSFWEKFNAQKEERREMMVDLLNQVIRAVAQQGDVIILGRSGFAILNNYFDVLNLRIQAPFNLRMKRIMVRKNITAFEAEKLVRKGDKLRSSFIKSFYGVNWDISSPFDLIIDTGKVPPDIGAKCIVVIVKALKERDILGETSTSDIQVDPILKIAVSSELAKLDGAY
ncbi:AAA family ATPase [Chloroflexota bacterium]